MRPVLTIDSAGRIELSPAPDASAAVQAVAGKRTLLRPTGRAFDAAAAVRAERETQAGAPGRGWWRSSTPRETPRVFR